jgi:site-specific recombinase XerD
LNELILTTDSLPVAAPDLAERIAEWIEDAREAMPANTWRALRADWRSFTTWCAAAQLCPLPALATTVAAYLQAEHVAGRKLATIRHRVATIRLVHTRAAGLPDPCKTEKVRLKVKAILKAKGKKGAEQSQAVPLYTADLTTVIEETNEDGQTHSRHILNPALAELATTTKGKRDLALVLMASSTMARASELVLLEYPDVTFDEEDDDATVNVYRIKTKETQECYLGCEATSALKDWLQAAGIDSGPLFIGLTFKGKVTGRMIGGVKKPRPLNVREVGRILKSVGARIGKPDLSGHSARVGMCEELVQSGAGVAAVMNAGNWRSPSMIAKYTRKTTAKKNAVATYLKDKLR